MNIDKVNLRHVMLYEFRKGITVSAALKNIQNVYQDQAPGKRTVEKWFAKFRRGEFNLQDEARSGRPSDLVDDVLRALVRNNPRILTEELSAALNVDQSTVFRRLKSLGFDLKLDIWVPHLLTEQNKIQRISAAVSLLGRFNNESFLDRLVTGDEKWILYNNVRRKRTWKRTGEHGDAMPKAALHPMKVMLSVWWDCKGIIYFEFLPTGETIDSDKYCGQLTILDQKIK